MKLALVSGDGLPVSGLLTIFRNVVEPELAAGRIDAPVAADLGYSWRPDKEYFFPAGRPGSGYPAWMTVSDAVPVTWERGRLMGRLTAVRAAVARAGSLDQQERAALHRDVEEFAGPYEEYFTRWLAEHDPDWVVAVNMTLSDAVPVTLGLHRAAARRWTGPRPGGVLFWDHDLFGSCAIYEDGARVYPAEPNEFTPVPGSHPCHRWAVVSPALAREVAAYPTDLTAPVLPNVLPDPADDPAARPAHDGFRDRHGLDPDRPLLLVPVRMFRVKGVEIALELLAEATRLCEQRGTPAPYLVVFGSLGEDPPYAREVLRRAEDLGVAKDIVFLDGVPLATHRDPDGDWHLDEVDLLRLCRASGGAVLFTPSTADVESVGLGPALAAVAGVPCAVTPYTCFEDFYGTDSSCVRVTGREPDALERAARALLGLMDGAAAGDPTVRRGLERDRDHVLRVFDPEPWRAQLREMAHEARSR